MTKHIHTARVIRSATGLGFQSSVMDCRRPSFISSKITVIPHLQRFGIAAGCIKRWKFNQADPVQNGADDDCHYKSSR